MVGDPLCAWLRTSRGGVNRAYVTPAVLEQTCNNPDVVKHTMYVVSCHPVRAVSTRFWLYQYGFLCINHFLL